MTRWHGYLLLVGVLLVTGTTVAAPEPALEAAVDAAYQRALAIDDGETAQYIPALADADPDGFALVVATVDGTVIRRGDADTRFAIMSAAKPFTLALLLAQRGPDFVRNTIGVEPTGRPFNDFAGINPEAGAPLNPLVNAGAIAAVSHLQVPRGGDRWVVLHDFYQQLAGSELQIMAPVYASVGTSNFRNRAVVNLLEDHGRLGADPDEALDVYNRQSCVGVSTTQLATMGATLANAGVHPVSDKRVLDAAILDELLAVMFMAGLYDEAGRWAWDVGLPAKSGVGGGIVAIVPGRMAIAAWSPRLSPSGNSVRATAAITALATQLELGLFSSR